MGNWCVLCERFTEVLESINPSLNILNFGVSGYGQLQEYLILDKILEHDIDEVILVICLANDILDNIYPVRYGYSKPYATLSSNNIGFEIKGYPLYNNRRFNESIVPDYYLGEAIKSYFVYLRGKIPEILHGSEEKDKDLDYIDLYAKEENLNNDRKKKIKDALEVTVNLLLAIRDKITEKKSNVKFSVVLAPTKFELGIKKVDKKLKIRNFFTEVLQRNNILFFDGTDVIEKEDFWKYDGHWRPSGHKKIANLINNKYIKLE